MAAEIEVVWISNPSQQLGRGCPLPNALHSGTINWRVQCRKPLQQLTSRNSMFSCSTAALALAGCSYSVHLSVAFNITTWVDFRSVLAVLNRISLAECVAFCHKQPRGQCPNPLASGGSISVQLVNMPEGQVAGLLAQVATLGSGLAPAGRVGVAAAGARVSRASDSGSRCRAPQAPAEGGWGWGTGEQPSRGLGQELWRQIRQCKGPDARSSDWLSALSRGPGPRCRGKGGAWRPAEGRCLRPRPRGGACGGSRGGGWSRVARPAGPGQARRLGWRGMTQILGTHMTGSTH